MKKSEYPYSRYRANRGRFVNKKVFKHTIVEKYAWALVEAGYQVFYPKDVEWRSGFHFVKSGRIGSCEYNRSRGWCFYRLHKPSENNGSATPYTGPYALFSDPKVSYAENTLNINREDVKHYENWDEYAKKSTIEYGQLTKSEHK